MGKWGEVPDDIALTSRLVELSEEYYGGAWGVGATVFDRSRPEGWASTKRILSHHGLPQSAAGWAKLMERLTGLRTASHSHSNQRNAERRWGTERREREAQLDQPVQQLGDSEWRQAVAATEEIVFIERWRPIKRWDCRRHRYEVIGKEKVYEVR